MKSIISTLLFCCCLAMHVQAQTPVKPRLSPQTRHYLELQKKSGQSKMLPDGYVYKQYQGQYYISALVLVADAAAVQAAFKNAGILTGTKAGNIWTVQVPLDKVQQFSQTTGILYIQLDEPVFPQLDVARKTTRVDSVHKGYNLPQVYSGKNVVMGVVDFGFDYNHPTLYDTLGGRYRVKKVWELNATGTPPAGYIYGHEAVDSNTIRARGTDDPRQTHGTGVTGIAAGSGYGGDTLNSRFRGMAYDADLVFVGVRRDSIGTQWMQSGFSDFIDAVSYIFNYASSVGKPAVVNISWGSQSGPHDGSSLFNQACNNLSGPGKIIVMSAGNEGEEKIHLSKQFTTTDTLIRSFLTFTSPAYKRTWVDVWGETGKTFCASATLYSGGNPGNSTGFICIDDNTHSAYLIGNNGLDTCFVDIITSSAEFNGKPRVTLSIFNKASDSVVVAVKGTSGTVHLWDEYYYYGYKYRYQSAFSSAGQPWAQTGNTVSTVSDMGSATSVLLVGAYASKVNFKDINGNNWSYSSYVAPGNIVPFSSRGPMIDGRIKPDITAPGMTLGTAVSSFDTSYTPVGSNSELTVSAYTQPGSGKKFYYSEFSGTSASSPAAAGIVALLLQRKPDLTPQQVKDLLFTTAIKDTYTGNLPAAGNNTWGHGKINAYGALKLLMQQTGVYYYNGRKLDCVLFPNPNEGSFVLDYTGQKEEELELSIYNISGSKVASQLWKVQPGNNRRPMDVSQLPKGSYLVNVLGRDGSVSIKTVIQ